MMFFSKKFGAIVIFDLRGGNLTFLQGLTNPKMGTQKMFCGKIVNILPLWMPTPIAK